MSRWPGNRASLRDWVALRNDTRFIPFRRVGTNINVNSSWQDVWNVGGIRVLPSSPTTMQIVSDSVNDTFGGSGAWVVVVYGLTTDYVFATEIVVMNGIVPVNTVTPFLRINNVDAVLHGSLGWNDGNIDIADGANIQARIEPTDNTAQLEQYTVPAGYTLLVFYQSSFNDKDVELVSTVKFEDSPRFHLYKVLLPSNSDAPIQNNPFIPVSEKADTSVQVRRVAGASASRVTVYYNGYLVENDVSIINDEIINTSIGF